LGNNSEAGGKMFGSHLGFSAFGSIEFCILMETFLLLEAIYFSFWVKFFIHLVSENNICLLLESFCE
jgi:hypothetical protein